MIQRDFLSYCGQPKFFWLLCFVCFSFWDASAQLSSVHTSEPINVRNDFGYEIIGELRDRTLLFRDEFSEFTIHGFDKNMNLSFTKELDFDKKGVKVLAVIGAKNDFCIFYKATRKGRTTLHINKYDPGANLIDTMTIMDYGDRAFRQPTLELVKSENKNCVGIFNTMERESLEIICFDIDKMTTLWNRVIPLDKAFFDASKRALILGNQGEFFVVSEYANRRARKDDHHFLIHRVYGTNETELRLEMPENLTTDAFYAYDNANKRLACIGLFSNRNTEITQGMYLWTLGISDAEAVLSFDNFDERFVSQVRGKTVDNENRGINDIEIVDMLFRKDGGVVGICEKRELVGRGLASSRGLFRDSPRMVIDYYYDDIFTVTFDGARQLAWRSVMQKKQYSQDDDGIFSSYFLMRSPESLHLLYNDEIRYENTCSEYILFPDGNHRRRSLLNTSEKKLRIRFRDGLQVGPNTVILPSEYRNKLSLVRLEY